MSPAHLFDNGPIGVVLFQLGGPDSLDAVEPFLYNLFCDPDIIAFPFARLTRPSLARLMASRRAKIVREHYKRIGGKSPLGELTELQAGALEKELRKTLDARVLVAMRYWHPLTEETAREVEGHAFRQLVLLPLYPQYSRTTTGSSLNEWHRKYPAGGNGPAPTKIVREFYNHPLYVEAVVDRINQTLAGFDEKSSAAPGRVPGCAPPKPGNSVPSGAISPLEASSADFSGARVKLCPDRSPSPDAHLVFSAHGLPRSVISAGDRYQAQVEATVALVMERGRWSNPYCLCYQSRVGPGQWLEPSLRETLGKLALQGADRILVIPVAFVSDHVETLYEIDIEAREAAQSLGVREFRTMPGLNDSPKFIQALADLVLGEVGVRASASS